MRRIKREQRRSRPIEDKESFRWQLMLETSTQDLPANTRVVTVADREADIVDFFAAAVRLGRDVLVRAAHNRRLNDQEAYLWDAVKAAPVIGHLQVEVPRAHQQPSRPAESELRTARVTLRPPVYRKAKTAAPAPVTLNAILAREHTSPDGQEGICWLLLTTLPIRSVEEAAACVVLWPSTRSSWRLLYLIYMARVEPHTPCTAFLSTSEWQALYCRLYRTNQVPDTPPDIQTALIWIARLGGFLARKGDGAHAVKVLWRGHRRLEDLTAMWDVLRPR